MRPGVVDGLGPGGEQPVQPGQAGDLLPVADLDQELLPDNPEKPFYFPPALRPARCTVGDLDAEPGGGPLQRPVHERGTVVDVDGPGDAAGGQRRAQRGGEADGVLEVPPPGGHHRPGMIVQEAEQECLAARDVRAVQCVPGPQLVRPGGLKPAERGGSAAVRAGGQLEPLEVALQRAHRRGPAAVRPQDPLHLRGSAAWLLPFQRGGQLQGLRAGARHHLPRWRDQGIEPASPPAADPPVDRCPRHGHRVAERARVRPGRQLTDQPAALAGGQGRVSCLADQLVAEQRHLLSPIGPAAFLTSS
jgi:hypothetical protein